MPSIYFKSKVKTVSESCTLTLIIRHNILVGPASDVWYAMKQPPPEQVDVLLASQLQFTISGTVNGSRMSPESVMASRIAHHFAEYFRLVGSCLVISVPESTHSPFRMQINLE
ncbi:hypothetical protein M413DRAFT_399497 [Hebeloma cylindrosporum]|uniref:Uncharacterized protein n=1 Tax=Hebeloma cylindrosporum TaxID=76867 RepID=A0A0C3CI20_HEBCY|nr:hypothetical protein M413DRAFT_399497 [Hebeloma cylindrosporum h7]